MDLETQIPADADSVAHIVELIERFLLCHKVEEEDRFRCSVCLSEVLNNVVEHGYENEPGNSIELGCSIQDAVIEIQVIDHSRIEFKVPDPDLPEGDTEDGRGWHIIKSWARKIEIKRTESGNQLIMQINRS